MVENLQIRNTSSTHKRAEVPRKPSDLNAKEGRVPLKRDGVQALAYQRPVCLDAGKQNSTNMVNKLPKAQCRVAREGKIPGTVDTNRICSHSRLFYDA